MAAAENPGSGRGIAGMSTVTFLIAVTGLTLLAAGAGFLGGMQILSRAGPSTPTQANGASAVAVQNVSGANVRVLTPIVTNLAGGPHVWIRLESSLIFPNAIPDDADALAARISEDIVAFLRTLTVEQIQGASGFQHLCDDLNDRVRVRSNGRVRELIVQGLIIE